ncbi:MAG: fibronectin type III domain-containing protein [Candidatus Sumerlaeaceae bacterium]
MRGRGELLAGVFAALGVQQVLAVPDTMARDQIIEIAYEAQLLKWYCETYNIYSGVANATCPYSAPGWQQGISYKWGGTDTRDSFWKNVVTNHGWAGDTNSAAIVSGTYGDDCSGYASNCLRSGRYTTSSFPSICTQVTYTSIAPGDLMNNAGSHVRIFEKYTGTNLTMLLECTTGVSPGRVTRRVLATDSNYVPLRYNYVVAWPSLTKVVAGSGGSATVEFLGAATTGFRVYTSTDAATWSLAANETLLGPQSQQCTLSGLQPGTTYFVRVTAVNGSTETSPSPVLAMRIAPAAKKILLVNGYDRWTRKTESGGNAHTFLVRDAKPLATLGFAFDSVDNLRVLDRSMSLSSYDAVWWLLGDESSTDDALSYQEQLALQDYLEAGGNLFISGSELLYDLVAKANTINDLAFVQNYLKCGYASDGTAGNGYAFTGVAGSVFQGLAGSFDNGSSGTFNVYYPDVLTPQGASVAVLQYATGGTAGIQYTGTVGNGSKSAKICLAGFPFETITSESVRFEFARRVANFFFAPTEVGNWKVY